MRASLALATATAAALCSGCITETFDAQGRPIERSSEGRLKTRGVIIREPLAQTWPRVKQIVESMASAPVRSDGLPHSLRTTVAGADTSILVEAFDTERTIVHIRSSDSSVEERIRLDVMRGVGG